MEGEHDRSRSGDGAYPSTGSGRFGADPFGGTGVDELPPREALKSAGRYIGELKAYAGNLLSAKADALKLTVKRLVVFAGLGVVGLIIGGAVLVTAAVLFLSGLANLFSAAFNPPKPWFGQLIVGFLVLAGTGVGTWLMLKKLTGASKSATVKKYEQLHEQQRREYGHDVPERSRETSGTG